MVDDTQNIPTDDQLPATEKKEKTNSRSKYKRSKSRSKSTSSYKSNKKDSSDRDDVESNTSADKDGSNSESKIHQERKGNSSNRNSTEIHKQVNDINNVEDESNVDEDVPPRTRTKTPATQRSSKKGKKGSRKQSEKTDLSDMHIVENEEYNMRLDEPIRLGSDTNSNKVGEVGQEKREKRRSNGRSQKSSGRTRDSVGTKEDTKPSLPRRASDVRENEEDDVDKFPFDRKLRRNSRQKEGSNDDDAIEQIDDKHATKPTRRTTRRVSPESKSDAKDDNELSVGSFHSLRKDSDKPRSRSKSKSGSRRISNHGRRNKTPTGGKSNRRRVRDKDKSLYNSDHVQLEKKSETLDDGDNEGTVDFDIKDEEVLVTEQTRTRRERRRDRERLVSNEMKLDVRKMKPNTPNASRLGKSSLSTRRGGLRRSHSERWNRVVESPEGEVNEHSLLLRRRSDESSLSLNRAGDAISRSTHSRIRRNHSTGLARMTPILNNRTYHGFESERRAGSDGRRTPRRATRRHQSTESSPKEFEDTIDSFGDGRSQATLGSIEDFEDFGEDFYGMELQTPGMVDFEEEILDLMQRPNPEVTDHLDRRVHRKREMVAYDHNMPMMTRQALLTRQASSQVQRQFLDGNNIDKKRLLLRNDSLNSSSHLVARAHGRRAPPRAKSSGLGAMGGGGYMDIGGQSEMDDRRGVFRTRSSQSASFNQYYQNKPNKVRNLTRKTSGDLIQPHTMRGQRSSVHRPRPVQRASSTTSIRRTNPPSDHAAPRKPERRMFEDENRRRMATLDDKSNDILDRQNGDKNDMSNKRNRSKLHFLMYMTKMSVDMDLLFQKVREGETPRSPIDTLRMPSP